MIPILIIFLITIVCMILSVIFIPSIKIKKLEFQPYWVICLIGALLMIILGFIKLDFLGKELIKDTSVNPIKILTLFISMTVLSVYLDELGFFKYLASLAIRKAGNKQFAIFISLYLITSFLTVFTSNDIIILTLTPFICYFCKNAKINPIPYLLSEFVSANTWSMMLIIGNPTNIYLGTMAGISFFEYVKMMVLPTIAGGVTSFLLILLIFRKTLKKEMEVVEVDAHLDNKFMLILGLVHLIACIILLAISSYVNLEIWIITLGFALSLIVCTLVYQLITKTKDTIILRTVKRAPWTLIPFVLSMFVMVLSLTSVNIPEIINNILNKDNLILEYGFISFISANLLNNIPMSVFFSNCLANASSSLYYSKAIYATIISSNIGAFLTPIGALAGIMWMSILKRNKVNFTFGRFMKYGSIIAIPTLIISLLVLLIV